MLTKYLLAFSYVRLNVCEEEELYYLFRDENGKWLLIKPRYEDERLEDILLGKRIQVSVAAVIDQDVIHSDCFRLSQVDYFGIGAIAKAKNG